MANCAEGEVAQTIQISQLPNLTVLEVMQPEGEATRAL